MKDKFFLDTNILIYSFDASNPSKQEIADTLIQKALSSSQGCISFQVIQEFLNVATNNFSVPLSKNQCYSILLKVLDPLCEIVSGTELYQDTLEIQDEFHYSFYDSMIISAALKAGCTKLYTEDLQHGQKIHTLTIENPFIGI